MIPNAPDFPEPSPGRAVFHLMCAGDRGWDRECPVLSPAENARALRFRFALDRQRWIGWRTGMRRILAAHLGISPSAVPLVENAFGKPLLAAPHDDWHFNLSHATDFAALVITRGGPVGIDIEPTVRSHPLADCIESFCHQGEIASLPSGSTARELALLRLWTAKEALLKALGTGMSHPPQEIRISGSKAAADSHWPALDDLHLVFPPSPPGHLLAIALPSAVRELDFAGTSVGIDIRQSG